LNFGIHGISDANQVIFALGNTVINLVGLWVYLPFRQRRAHKAHTQAILHGVKAT
jgi:hypothetical protein